MLRRIFGNWEKTEQTGCQQHTSRASKFESDHTSIMSAPPSVASSGTLTDNAAWETASLAGTIPIGPYSDPEALKASDSQESPPAARPVGPQSVRLCSHETLPFDRASKIVNLPNFKEYSSPLDALGAKPIPQHTRDSAAEPYECSNASGFKVTCNVKYYVLPEFWTGWKGMILDQTWRQHRLHKKQTCDKSTLQAYFSKENDFAFCPHLRASSDEVVDRAFRLVCPDAAHPDPVEEWALRGGSSNSSGDIKLSCSKCKTELTFYGSSSHIRIHVKRHLGECASPEDEFWLQQCEQDNA